jgi:hypothetical protein
MFDERAVTFATTADATCTSGAIKITADYTKNGKTEWHLPSKYELNELCKYAGQEATGGPNVACTAESGSLRTGFSADYYWSSSEYSATLAWSQFFGYGNRDDSTAYGTKTIAVRVRPVRAF